MANTAGMGARVMLLETFLHWSATRFFRPLALVVPAAYLLLNILRWRPRRNLPPFPFFIVQIAVMTWITQGRRLPIMADLSELLVRARTLWRQEVPLSVP